MEIKSICVQCTELGVCFTNFGSVSDIVECVTSVLEVGKGVNDKRKFAVSVQLMFHEVFCDIIIPHTYNFFVDMPIIRVKEYIEIELIHAKLV